MVEVGIPSFKPGMEAEVRFYAPNEKVYTSFNLIKDENNYMIHGAFRWDQKKLVLNTKSGGYHNWGTEVSVPIDFKSGADVAIRFSARESDDAFDVTVNGKHVYRYPYRLPLSDIKKMKTIPTDSLELISYTMHF